MIKDQQLLSLYNRVTVVEDRVSNLVSSVASRDTKSSVQPKFFLVFTGEAGALQKAIEKAYEQSEEWIGENNDWCMFESVRTETVAVVKDGAQYFYYNITATYIDLDQDKDGEDNDNNNT